MRKVSERTGTPQPLSATATWAMRPRAVGGRQCQFVAVDLRPRRSRRSHAGRRPRHRRSPSTSATIRSVPIERLRSVGSALGLDQPLGDDADAVGQLVGLFEVLRRQEDRDAVVVVELDAPRPTPPTGWPGRGRSSVRRGRGSGGGGSATSPGRGVASCRPSTSRPGRRSPCRCRRGRSRRSSAWPTSALLKPYRRPCSCSISRPVCLPSIERVLQCHADAQPDVAGLGGDVEAGHRR